MFTNHSAHNEPQIQSKLGEKKSPNNPNINPYTHDRKAYLEMNKIRFTKDKNVKSHHLDMYHFPKQMLNV